MKIEGVKAVITAMEKLKKSMDAQKTSVVVGYTANYAIFVHEDLKARHAPGKQAKYLEQPARQLNNDGTLGKLIVKSMKGGASMIEALSIAGLRLQRESQKIVPISGWDAIISPPGQGSGNLKGSAFTRKE